MPDSANPGASSLQKSAFWIYGVTAMIMREPFSTVLRHLQSAGFADPQVRLELLRVAVVLLLLSRLFLATGLYFEIVYMSPESGPRFPRRSYPFDFLAGILELLLMVATSTTVALPGNLFPVLLAAFLLGQSLWFLIAKAGGYSAASELASRAWQDALMLAIAAAVEAASGSEAAALLVILVFGAVSAFRLVRAYEKSV